MLKDPKTKRLAGRLKTIRQKVGDVLDKEWLYLTKEEKEEFHQLYKWLGALSRKIGWQLDPEDTKHANTEKGKPTST